MKENKLGLMIGISIFLCSTASAATDTGRVKFKSIIAETCNLNITPPTDDDSIVFSDSKTTTVPGGLNPAYVKLSSNKAGATLNLKVTSTEGLTATQIGSSSALNVNKSYVLFKEVDIVFSNAMTSAPTSWSILGASAQAQSTGKKFSLVGGVALNKDKINSGTVEFTAVLEATCF